MRTVVAADLVKLHLMDITPPRDNEFLVQLGRNDSMSQLDRRASYPASGERFRSLPDGFRAADYYRLNPDVAAATVDANDHYVEYGANEGRVWR